MLDLFSTVEVEVIAPLMTLEESRVCVNEIKDGIVNVRRRLLEWDERKGWKALGYASFREGAQAEFGYRQSYVYELRASAEVERNLLEAGLSSALESPIPQRQLHPLMSLSPDLQREAWREAVDTAPNGKVTGPHVQAVVDRMTKPEPEDDEPDIYDLNIWCSGCIHCRNVDDDLDFCKKYDKTIYPIGSMYGDLYGDAGQAATCPEYRDEPEDEPEPIKLYPIVAANHAETEGDDWCTPIEYVDAVREVLGTIDLDPATNEYGQSIIGASKFYTKQDDGLVHEWRGRVFLNPPYSVPMIDKFASKLLAEYMTGNVTEAIVLTNNSTETQWFQGLLSVCQVVCFPSRRLKFWKNGNEVFATRQGQAFFYFGTSDKFAKVFAAFGTVLGKYDDKQPESVY